MEYALQEGMTAVGGVQETYFMPRHAALGWIARSLGLPRQFGDETYIVAYIEVNEEALESVRKILGIDHSLLVQRGAQRPFQPVAPLALPDDGPVAAEHLTSFGFVAAMEKGETPNCSASPALSAQLLCE